jgi:hypothetical protein
MNESGEPSRSIPAGFPSFKPDLVLAPPRPGPPPDLEPLDGFAQLLGALFLATLPLVIPLYAIGTANSEIPRSWRFGLGAGIVQAYGFLLVGVGLLLGRRVERIPVARIILVCAGVFAPVAAAAGWIAPRNNLVLVNAVGAALLVAAAASAHARFCGRRIRTVLPLVLAVLVLGLGGRLAGFVGRPSSSVMDVLAIVLACSFFLRPERGTESPERVVLAFAVPVASVLCRVLWWPWFPQFVAIAVAAVWALRALRPYVQEGTITILALALVGVPLGVSIGAPHSRHLGAAIGLAGLLRMCADVEHDANVGVLDRRSPAWLAGGVWLFLAGTWANDLRVFVALFDLEPGLRNETSVWFGLFALPFAVPPFALAYLRRRAQPLQNHPEEAPPGSVTEVVGWSVLALVMVLALWSVFANGTGGSWPLWAIAAGTAALIGAVWAYLAPSPAGQIAAHSLLVAAVLGFTRGRDSELTVLAAAAVALALALAPLFGASKNAGWLGFALFPLLVGEALLRDAPIPAAAVLLTIFGLIQLVRAPLAEAPWTRIAGPVALVAAAWLIVSMSARVPEGLVELSLPTWIGSNPLLFLGAFAALLSVPLFALARHQRQQQPGAGALSGGQEGFPVFDADQPDPGMAFEAFAWTLVTLGSSIALTSSRLTWLSIVILVFVGVVATAWAKLVPTPLRRGGGLVLILAAVWAMGHWASSHLSFFIMREGLARASAAWPLLSASVVACALALSPLPLRGAAIEAGWVGLTVFPFAIVEALAVGAPVLPAAGLLFVFGVGQAVAPPLVRSPWTRGAGPLALLGAGWLILFGGGFAPPLLGPPSLPLAAALALVPLGLWVALTDGPIVFLIEVVVGALVLVFATCSPAALLPLVVLSLGRGFLGRLVSAPALLVGAAIVAVYGPRSGVDAVAGALSAAGGALLFRPVPLEVDKMRGLAPLPLALAPLVWLFLPRSSGHGWLGIEHLPLAAAVCVLPFAIAVRRKGGPSFLVQQTIAASGLIALMAIGAAFIQPVGSRWAIEATSGALLALLAVVTAARPLGPEVVPVVWGAAALAAPLAFVSTSSDTWHWPVAVVGALEVIVLGVAARRRMSPVLAAWTSWIGLLVAVWAGAAAAERISGDSPTGILAAAGAGAALAGTLVLLRGGRWLAAPSFFFRPYIHTCLALAAAAVVAAGSFGPVGSSEGFLFVLFGAAAVVVLCIGLACKDRIGWPLHLAVGGLILAYLYLRTRVAWMAWGSRTDAFVAVAAGLLMWGVERFLRRGSVDSAALAMPIAPDEVPFAVPEVRFLAAALMGLSAVAFFDFRSPFDALGPILAAGFFYRRADVMTPIYGVLAAVFFNFTVVFVMIQRDLGSPVAYALPICASSAVLLHVYRHHLGHDGGALRTLPALGAILASGYEALGSSALGPSLILAATALVLLMLSRRWGLRSHLVLGIAALLLAGIDLSMNGPSQSGSDGAYVFRLIPAISLLAALLGAVLISQGPRLFVEPGIIVPPLVHGLLGLASVAAGLSLVVAPSDAILDVALTLLALAAVGGLAAQWAFRRRVGWPLVLAGGVPALAFGYLRARTTWLDPMQHWDALAAVVAGVLIGLLERAVRRATGVPVRPGPFETPDQVPFAVPEIRFVSAFVVALSAIAFLDLHAPSDAIGPVLAILFFLRRSSVESPIYGVLTVVFLDTTICLFLANFKVVSPTLYAWPIGISVAVLLHVYRESLGDEAAALRTLPPLAVAAASVYEATNARGVMVPAASLLVLGFGLLGLSRLWRLRSHVPLGAGCLGAALLCTITDWNARGWTVAAIALGVITLLVPAALLRWR